MKYFWMVFASLLFLACQTDTKKKEIAKIPIEFDLIRFDKIFASATPQELPRLKKEYPQFFPERFADSVWEFRMRDTLQQQLNTTVIKQFPTEEHLYDDLKSLFQHIQYYFPEFVPPTVYTTTSDVDYRTKVIATDSLLVIALDTYLGSDHPFYDGIPRYIAQNLSNSQLLPDVAAEYARKFIVPTNDRSLLSQMIYYGRIMYLKDLWLTSYSDADKIGYTEDELAWAKTNEAQIWTYFVESEMLYGTDPKLLQRFILPAPFSKFNLEIDNESPGRIGQWIGWQIVRSYMEENPVSVEQLMRQQPKEIYELSKYKPQK